ncbi:MAG: hypothetical protein U1F15_08930 [Burkholderiales bacterium]
MDRSKHNPELEAKLAKLHPTERNRVESVGRRLAKASLRKMLDNATQLSASPKTYPKIEEAIDLPDRRLPDEAKEGHYLPTAPLLSCSEIERLRRVANVQVAFAKKAFNQ